MSDLTQPITNPELAQAVADMAAQGSRASREAVLDIVISKARFLAPVTISPAPEQQESAPLGEGTAIQFQLLCQQTCRILFRCQNTVYREGFEYSLMYLIYRPCINPFHLQLFQQRHNPDRSAEVIAYGYNYRIHTLQR